MIGSVRYTVVLILLIILFKFCHLITHSQTSMTINVDSSQGLKALKTFSTSFSHELFKNFSLFHVLTDQWKSSLFVVCNSDTILEMSVKDLKLIKVYRTDFCNHLPKYQCEDAITINLLSEINVFHQPMIWFCYIPLYNYLPSPNSGHCTVPKNKVISNDITWTKRGYTSTSHSHKTFAIQTKQYIFIGSHQQNSLVVLRTMLPDYGGNIDSKSDLVTPMAEFYFERNSRFLEVFATKYEVYYVVVEPLVSNSNGISECLSSPNSKTVITARLFKVCKDDPGTVHHDNERNFGTAAKADIVCPMGTDVDQYLYTSAISASWSGDRLYILFDSQRNSPSGKVLCVYDEFSFNAAFNSEMVPPKMFANMDKINVRVNQPIEDLCQKLTKKTLNNKETEEASSMSVNGLYRSRSIFPIRSVPVMKLGDNYFHTLSAFRASKTDLSIVIVLIEKHNLRLVVHLEDYTVCHLSDIRLEGNETINNVKGSTMQSESGGETVVMYVSTTRRMIQMDLGTCDNYREKISCMREASPLCGWDTRQGRCTILTDDVEKEVWERSDCRTFIRTDDMWTVPESCRVNDGQETLRCVCKYCKSESGCVNGQKVDITNCFAVPNTETVDVFDNWGPWTECSYTNQNQKRTRKCRGTRCIGARVEYRNCSTSSKSEITSNWTEWYRTDNDKYLVSFRTKCTKNKFMLPAIEGRQKVCLEACDDSSSSKWSVWSQCIDTNIQYRLLNCSSFDLCPQTQLEVKSCPLRSSKYRHSKGSYSTIHIILAVLATSLVWIIILISVGIALFRYNNRQRRKSTHSSSKQRQFPPRRTVDSFYRPSLSYPTQSFLSETSNDYLSSGLTSPVLSGTSISDTIHSEHRTHSSNESYTHL